MELWKKYIQWEKNNPLRTEDPALITKRGTNNYSNYEFSYSNLYMFKPLCYIESISNKLHGSDYLRDDTL